MPPAQRACALAAPVLLATFVLAWLVSENDRAAADGELGALPCSSSLPGKNTLVSPFHQLEVDPPRGFNGESVAPSAGAGIETRKWLAAAGGLPPRTPAFSAPASIDLGVLNERQRAMARRLKKFRPGSPLAGGGASGKPGEVKRTLPPAWICFAPDTPPEVIIALTGSPHGHFAVAPSLPSTNKTDKYQAAAFQFFSPPRWTDTATNNTSFFNRLGQGDATVLTWSIVEDGLLIPGGTGEPDSPSDLRARLDSIYPGGESEWLPLFEQVFARWSEVTGVKYIYQPNDSGGFPDRSGSNSRGDIRIAGHPIDGDFGSLAYNYGPNGGDMVIDTDDAFFNNTFGNSRRLRNVIAHEHGHGLGLAHVCPIDGSKLMEPNANTAFDGPQLDDIYSAQRQYGDRLEDPDSDSSSENNDSLARASPLGTLGQGIHLIEHLSIDDDSDQDYLRFTPARPDMQLRVELRPVGTSYLEGPQNDDNTCPSGTLFNALAVHDLSLAIIDGDGTLLATESGAGIGLPEETDWIPIGGSSEVVIFVNGDSSNSCQLYELQITLLDPDDLPVATVANSSAGEESGELLFRVTLDAAPLAQAQVDFAPIGQSATAGEDYLAGGGTLTFPPGTTERFAAVRLLDDDLAEADETLTLALSNPSFLQIPSPTGGGAILDDDAPALLAGSATLSDAPDGGKTISWLAVPGRTYTVLYSDDLEVWLPLPGYESITIVTGNETATDPSPLANRRFYQVVEGYGG